MTPLKGIQRTALLLATVLLCSFTLVHKHYISLTHIAYSEKDNTFQITTRLFIDDIEALLKERYGLQAHLATPQEAKDTPAYLEKYIRSQFSIALNGTPVTYTFLGKQYEDDKLLCYMEIPGVSLSTVKTLTVRNTLLTDKFETQRNIVHVAWKDQTESFVLHRENNRKTLKL